MEVSASEEPYDEPVREPEAVDARHPVANVPAAGNTVPLFLRDGSDGPKGNAQDEKDEVGE
jgi:hypothetical protein